VIGATSEAHLEVDASAGRPTVAYLEALTRSADGSAKQVRTAHAQADAHVALRLHPGEAGSGYRFEDSTIAGAIPKHFMTSIDSGIRDSMAHGVLRGYPIVDVRVEVHDGSYHETDSTDAAFRTAAAMAFQDAAKKGRPQVLEPVMEVVVRAASTYVKPLLESLFGRRGEIRERAQEPDQEAITALVPLSELFGFEGQIRTRTHGRASCSIRFACYRPVGQGPASDDDHSARVGAPRRPAPHLRNSAASVPEPDESDTEN
jgi:elongation factor G